MASQLAQTGQQPELSVTERLLSRLLEDRATRYGDRVFLNFKGERTITYRELDETANRFANGLRALGLDKDKKIAVLMQNCPDYLHVLFGAAKIGAVIVPINTAYKGRLLSYIINNSDAGVLVVDEQYLDTIGEIGEGLQGIQTVLVNSPGPGSTTQVNKLQRFNSLQLESVAQAKADKLESDVRHTDTVMIMYTGGTTGPSKGVVMSNHLYYFYTRMVARSIGAMM